MKLSLLFIILLVTSCSSINHKQIQEFRELVTQRKFKEARLLSHSKTFYNDKQSKLLNLIERGLAEHFDAKYLMSSKTFEEAKTLGNKLFTVSISKKVKSMITDDTADNYYPSMMVQSQIRFYLALNYFLLSSQKKIFLHPQDEKKGLITKKIGNKKRRKFLLQARATLMEWDSLLKNFISQFKGKPVFKNDLSHKLLGAIIHEKVGTTLDKNIASKLLDEAKKLLNQNYAMFDFYNKKHLKYNQDFSKLHTLKRSEFIKNYTGPTKHYQNLISYIKQQKKRIKSKKKENLTIVLQYGIVPPKTQSITFVPLPVTKGLTMTHTNIKLPEIRRKKHIYDFAIEVDGKTIPMVTMNPISTVVYKEFQDELPSIKAKTITRFITKQLTSATASAASQKANNDSSGALAILSIVSSISQALEEADTRQWSILPHEVRLVRAHLSQGKHELSLLYMQDGNEVMRKKIGNISIPKKGSKIINFKI